MGRFSFPRHSRPDTADDNAPGKVNLTMHNRKKIRGRGYGHDTLAVAATTPDGQQLVIPADRICSVHATFSPRAKGDGSTTEGLDFHGAHLAGMGMKDVTHETWKRISTTLELDSHFATAEFGIRLFPYEAVDPASAAAQAFIGAALEATGQDLDEDAQARLLTAILGRPAPVTGPRAALRNTSGEVVQRPDWPALFGVTVLPTKKHTFNPEATQEQLDTLMAATTVDEIGAATRPILEAAAGTTPLLEEAITVAPNLTGHPAVASTPTGGAVFLYSGTVAGRRDAYDAAWELRRRFAYNHVRSSSTWKADK